VPVALPLPPELLVQLTATILGEAATRASFIFSVSLVHVGFWEGVLMVSSGTAVTGAPRFCAKSQSLVVVPLAHMISPVRSRSFLRDGSGVYQLTVHGVHEPRGLHMRNALLSTLACLSVFTLTSWAGESKPNFILVMADDQGWGQTGYYKHPILKTPHLDQMAANGLRFDRFYAGAPVCSPTRASVLTGRANDRTGVFSHGYAMRTQEKTVAQALKTVGYVTGHFGKWHLNGLRGPGVPVLGDDKRNPGCFGFDEWLTVTNFFDRNPLMSRKGKFEDFKGDSSEVIVAEALKFIRAQHQAQKPFLAVVWYGSPHSPWVAGDEDRAPFKNLKDQEQHHYGELVAMDRSIGALRSGLRELKIEGHTLVWFCSDNGGLSPFGPATVGGLRGFKGTIYEGGLRVPGIIEWPDAVKPRVTGFPACTMDIFPTLAGITGLPDSVMVRPQDGMDLQPLLKAEIGPRKKPIPFRFHGRGAWIDNDHKLIADIKKGKYELYDLKNDPKESKDIFAAKPEIGKKMKADFEAWNTSVEASVAGKDFPEGVKDKELRMFWRDSPAYKPYFKEWAERPEYRNWLKKKRK
jgi:arylsulfatase A-like enzyme